MPKKTAIFITFLMLFGLLEKKNLSQSEVDSVSRKKSPDPVKPVPTLQQIVRTPSLRCLGNYYGSAWVPLNHYIYYVFVCFLSLGQENHYIYNVFGLTIALRPRKPSIYGVLALTTALRPRTPIYLQLFFVLFGLLENKI